MKEAIEFYQNNCNYKFLWPEIPQNLVDNIEIAKWIFNQNIPFIDLDLTFNVSKWQKESCTAKNFYVPHRESQPHKGWKSCCLHGIDIDKTGVWQCYKNDEPEYRWTSLANYTPNIKNFWLNFPFEKYARIRFMNLESGGWINPHNDTPPDIGNNFDIVNNLIPVNIAIYHPDECFMTLKDFGTIPWTTGDIKIINIMNDHSVINFNSQSRIHLIAHGWVGNKIVEFSDLIVRSYKKQYECYKV